MISELWTYKYKMTKKQLVKTILLISATLFFLPWFVVDGENTINILTTISLYSSVVFVGSLGCLVGIINLSKQYGYKIINGERLYVKRKCSGFIKTWCPVSNYQFRKYGESEVNIRKLLDRDKEIDELLTQEFYEKYCVKKLGRKTKTIEYLN